MFKARIQDTGTLRKYTKLKLTALMLATLVQIYQMLIETIDIQIFEIQFFSTSNLIPPFNIMPLTHAMSYELSWSELIIPPKTTVI